MAEVKISRSQPVAAGILRLLLATFSRLPLPAAQGLGAALGSLAWLARSSPRRIARLNVDWCLPELDPARRRRIARDSLVALGRGFAEMGAVWRWPAARLDDLQEGVEGEEIVHRAMARGRGAVLLFPHLGNWEVMNTFIVSRWPTVALYRPPRIAEIERLMQRSRERFGLTLVPANRRGIRQLFQSLEEGKLVVILPDQEPVRSSGVFAPFFGIPALTMTLVSRLLRRFSSAAAFGYARRAPSGRFVFCFREPPEGLDAEDRVRAAASLNAGVERCVRECPEQYFWSYKRFKTRPPEEQAETRKGSRPARTISYRRRETG